MKTLQGQRVISLGQVNCTDTEQHVCAIELVRSLLVKLATLLVSLEREIVSSLHVTRVADQAKHARHADVIAIRPKSRKALVEVFQRLHVVSLQRANKTDAAEGHCDSATRRQLLSDRKTLRVTFECR